MHRNLSNYLSLSMSSKFSKIFFKTSAFPPFKNLCFLSKFLKENNLFLCQGPERTKQALLALSILNWEPPYPLPRSPIPAQHKAPEQCCRSASLQPCGWTPWTYTVGSLAPVQTLLPYAVGSLAARWTASQSYPWIIDLEVIFRG